MPNSRAYVGLRVFEGCDVIVEKARVTGDESGRHTVRTGLDENANRRKIHSRRWAFMHSLIDFVQSDRLAIDGNFELLAFDRRAEDAAYRIRIQH